jgi:hypothetical protein
MTSGMPRSRLIAVAAAAAVALGALPGSALADAIEDDYPRALAAAKERSVPIVVDAWAPW